MNYIMKNKLLFINLFFIALLFTFSITNGQINTPKPSPLSTVTQKVGLADVTITYSRPSAKGRKVFGDVVPYGKIWRTGANETTKLSFNDTVSIGGKKLAPGDYGLYTIPGEKEWTIIIGKNPKTGAGSYKDDEDAVRFKVQPEVLPMFVETFTMNFGNLTSNSADIMLEWEKTGVKFRVENEVDAKVMAQIKNRMDDIGFYWQAANYYYDTNRDLDQALVWVNKVVEKNPQFWTWHLKAKIESKLNNCKAATTSAQKSMELAKAANNEEYVKFNEKLIANCKGKK